MQQNIPIIAWVLLPKLSKFSWPLYGSRPQGSPWEVGFLVQFRAAYFGEENLPYVDTLGKDGRIPSPVSRAGGMASCSHQALISLLPPLWSCPAAQRGGNFISSLSRTGGRAEKRFSPWAETWIPDAGVTSKLSPSAPHPHVPARLGGGNWLTISLAGASGPRRHQHPPTARRRLTRSRRAKL